MMEGKFVVTFHVLSPTVCTTLKKCMFIKYWRFECCGCATTDLFGNSFKSCKWYSHKI